MLATSEVLIRLLVATVLCGLIGLERESKHKPAGLRTNILVGVGSCLVMLLSIKSGELASIADPTKIASGVITGIGFLGAGMIIQDQDKIHGITTAATIWIVSAIGLALGLGFYSAAIITTVIALVVLYFLSSDRLREKINLGNDHQ